MDTRLRSSDLESRRHRRAAWRRLAEVVFLTTVCASAQAQPLTREVEYAYSSTGLVTLERVDPGKAHCSETEYQHDAYGNRTKVTVRPCADVTSGAATFTPRVIDNVFDAKSTGLATEQYPAGAYLTKSIARRSDNSVAKQTEAVYDARFGAAIVQTDVAHADTSKSLSKRAEFDELGRLKREYIPVQSTGGAPIESYVDYQWVYCSRTGEVAHANCISYSTTVAANYASGMLVDTATGVSLTSALVEAVGAYYVESTPRNATGNVIGARSRVHYDSLHREVAKETETYSGQWSMTLTAFNALGMGGASWSAWFGRTAAGVFVAPPAELMQWTATLDLLHRPTEQRQYWRGSVGATAVVVSAQLAYNGMESSATVPAASSPDGVARTTVARKNALGKVVQTVDAYGATLSSAYDAVGNLVQTVDALGNITTIGYTATTARFKVSMSDPNQGAWSYAYDALGQLKTQTDAKGQETSLVYDELGRLTQKVNPTQNGFWYHDKTEAGAWCAAGLNRLCEAKAGNGATTISRDVVTYDPLARPVQHSTTHVNTYTSNTTYDTLGRVLTQRYPTGFTVQYAYSAAASGKIAGVLEKVSDQANASRVFWRIDTIAAASVFDARGNLVRSDLGNGLGTNHAFDTISGKAFNLRAGTAGDYVSAQDHRYQYDLANNVVQRMEAIQTVTETFGYDRLNRLSSYQTGSGSDAAANRTVTLDYNAIGNILRKGDVGGYAYAGVRPHALSSAGGTSYAYDANGQLESTSGNQVRSIAWTQFNQPASMIYQGRGITFAYDQEYRRVREVMSSNGVTMRVVDQVHPDNHGGLAYEREETYVSGVHTLTENRHYVSVGGVVVAVVKTNADSGVVTSDPNKTLYWHKDALGSIVAVTNASGTVLERMAFDAWGKRVRDTGLADPSLNPSHGDRGFTGHEHLDEMSLVHMNGRIYDPITGRMLSVDPVVGDPNDLQTYNRYSYVFNQPLRYADPSGNCPVCIFWFVAGTVMAREGNKYWSVVGRIMQFVALQNWVDAGLGVPGPVTSTFNIGGVGNSFLAAAGSSLASGQGLEDALQSGIFAMAFTAVGGSQLSRPALLAAHALLGCVQGAMSGGKCGPSAMAAFVGKAATVGLDAFEVTNPVAIGVVSTIAGGTASVIGGGKFANGALQSGFGYVFNHCTLNGCWVRDDERELFAAGRVREGYALSCKNGDGYACSALRVVNEAGAMETLTNMRLETSLINNGVVRSRYEAIPVMEAIKVDLGKAYVDYLDSLGASSSNPQWPTRAGIGNFHDQVFQSYGAGNVFGGRISDSLIPRGWFDWCSICKK